MPCDETRRHPGIPINAEMVLSLYFHFVLCLLTPRNKNKCRRCHRNRESMMVIDVCVCIRVVIIRLSCCPAHNLSPFIIITFLRRFCVGDRFYMCDNKILCEYDYEERMVFASMSYNCNALSQIKRQAQSLNDDVSSGYGSPSPSSL